MYGGHSLIQGLYKLINISVNISFSQGVTDFLFLAIHSAKKIIP